VLLVGKNSAYIVVLISLVKLAGASLFTLMYYDWWTYNSSADDVLLQSCSNPLVGSCMSYCNDIYIVDVNITHDDYRFDDNFITPKTSRGRHFSSSEYCVAEFRGYCAYNYWLVFKMVPILLHVVGFILQCMAWRHNRFFVPQQKQFDTIIAHRYPGLFTDKVDVGAAVSGVSAIHATSNLSVVLRELTTTPFYNIFAFLEVCIVLYVWGELLYPPIYCDSVRPLSLYYYPLLMSSLELVKFNMYAGVKLCALGRYGEAILACLSMDMFLTNSFFTTVLAGVYACSVVAAVVREVWWACISVGYRVMGASWIEASWQKSASPQTTTSDVESTGNPLRTFSNGSVKGIEMPSPPVADDE
jgi:hypothetical protein